MSDERKPTLILPAAFTLTVLLTLYVAIYYSTVEVVVPLRMPDDRFPAYPPLHKTVGIPYGVCAHVFTPIHQIDRRLRPDVWDKP